MLYYNRIDISEGVDPTKSHRSKECMICRYFFNQGSNFKILYAIVATIVTIKNVEYRCIIHKISKSEAINF